MLKKILLLFIALLMTQLAAANINQLPKVKSFITDMVQKYQFNQHYLENLFSQVSIKPPVIHSKTGKPLEKLTWGKYQKLYLTPTRIAEGAQYWQQNKNTLNTVEKSYGVSPEAIVGILGAETNYGRVQGGDQVITTLATMAFTDNRRATYFRSELVKFLLLCRDYQFSPLSIKGSYAGAIGAPQFMPSAYEKYAIDFQHRGKSDLMHNNADIIASIANYLKENGWQRDIPVAIPVTIHPNKLQGLPEQTFRPIYSAAQLKYFAITPLAPLAQNTKYRFIALQGQHGMEYWLGTENFYVITLYNHSTDYAMAVYELGRSIKAKVTQ